MINTCTGEHPAFLNGLPEEIDKILIKRAYATYLIVTNQTPEKIAKQPFNLTEVLPSLASLDQKWNSVEPEMLKTTYPMVHRLKTILERFRKRS